MIRHIGWVILVGLVGVGTTTPITGESVDESSLFQGESSIVSIQSSETIEPFDHESTTFSGSILSRNTTYWTRQSAMSDGAIAGYTQANFFLDSRLQRGAKLFIDLEISQLASGSPTQTMLATVRELFVDINYNRAIYLRTGKQVIQWGRCYFWNPTDLISIDHRDFFQLNRYRDGIYGTRLLLPGTNNQNTTLFVNQENVTKINQLSLAAKHEFMVGNSEIGLSGWVKPNSVSTIGIDFSTRWLGLDIVGESAFSDGENGAHITWDGITARSETIRNQWVNRSAITITKTWDWDLSERIGLSAELYYNSTGYTQSPFTNPSVIPIIFSNGLYAPNRMAQWYGATFLTIHEFPFNDSSAGINTIANLTDNSRISSLAVSFSPIVHTLLSTTAYLYWGDPNGEYTYAGNSVGWELSATISF